MSYRPDAVTEWVEHMRPKWKVRNFNPGQVKPMTDNNIDTYRYLVYDINGIEQGLVCIVPGWCDSVGYRVMVLVGWSPSRAAL